MANDCYTANHFHLLETHEPHNIKSKKVICGSGKCKRSIDKFIAADERYFDKRYRSLNFHLKSMFGKKVVKIPIDGGFTCPTRDGSAGFGGCTFCSSRGSGDFTEQGVSISQQFFNMKQRYTKWKDCLYIPYFQAYTGTYAAVDILEKKYNEALSLPDTCGLAIATRPDCLDDDIVNLLHKISQKTYLWVELGLQTANEETASLIHRGFDNSCFTQAVLKLKSKSIEVVAHIILGFPNETIDDYLNTVKLINSVGIDGIKIQMLNVLKNTQLEKEYPFKLITRDEYVSCVADILEHISNTTVIHRLTGDGKHDDLIAPQWIKNKKAVLNAIDAELAKRNTYQGKLSLIT